MLGNVDLYYWNYNDIASHFIIGEILQATIYKCLNNKY